MIFISQKLNLNYTSPRFSRPKKENKLVYIEAFYGGKYVITRHKKLSLYLRNNAIIFLILFPPISILLATANLIIRKVGVMYSKNLLWDLRTKLPMDLVLMNLESVLHIPFKESEGYIRFLCPVCNEMQATINPKNNFSHCFSCKKNFNNIDLLMFKGYSFSSSVEMLICQWDELKKEKPNQSANFGLAE